MYNASPLLALVNFDMGSFVFLQKLTGWLEARSLAFSASCAVLVLFVGALYSIWLGDRIGFIDEAQYLEIGKNIVERGEYTLTGDAPTAYRPPFYPIFLATFLGMGASLETLRVLNFLLLGFSLVLLSRLLVLANESLAAALVAPLALLYPLLLYTAGTLYPQILAGFLLCVTVYLLCHPQITLIRMTLAGIAFGLSILTVSLCLLLVPVLVLWSIMTRMISMKHMIWFCLVIVLTTLPWLVRNHAVFGTFPLFGTNSGINLLLGNSPDTRPNSGVRVDIGSLREQAAVLGELEKNQIYMNQAIENISKEPAKYIALYPKKVLNWFNVNPGLATVGQQKQAQVVLLTVSYAVLLGFVGLRLWQTRWKPLESHESLALLLYIAAAMIYAIFFTRVRFRVPFDLLLLVPAAQAASELIKKYVYPGKEKSQG